MKALLNLFLAAVLIGMVALFGLAILTALEEQANTTRSYEYDTVSGQCWYVTRLRGEYEYSKQVAPSVCK